MSFITVTNKGFICKIEIVDEQIQYELSDIKVESKFIFGFKSSDDTFLIACENHMYEINMNFDILNQYNIVSLYYFVDDNKPISKIIFKTDICDYLIFNCYYGLRQITDFKDRQILQEVTENSLCGCNDRYIRHADKVISMFIFSAHIINNVFVYLHREYPLSEEFIFDVLTYTTSTKSARKL